MSDIQMLPTDFSSLGDDELEGLTRSDQVIDPIVVIDIVGGAVKAKLAGARHFRGQRRIIFAPTNDHSWVLDGTTIRPLPKDAPLLFKSLICSEDNSSLQFGKAISLLRQQGQSLAIEASEAFLTAGRQSADALPENLSINGLHARLYPYQARGIQWMHQKLQLTGGLILADEMGLGKTLQIIATMLILNIRDEQPALVICPTSLIANWIREIEKFAPSLSTYVHRGQSRAGTFKGLQRAKVVICTYDTVVNDISIFSALKWSIVICDEAQAIKNPESARRKAISRIPRFLSIPMTGTPVENTLVDLWSLTDFAVPGLLGSRQEFEAQYPDGIESARAITKLVDPIILRRRVSDVAGDLPERIDIDVPLLMDEDLAEYYVKVREEALSEYPIAGALVATLRLQLACAHPWLTRNFTGSEDADDADILELPSHGLITPKLERTLAIISEAFSTGKKVLVFSLFNKIGEIIIRASGDLSGVYWNQINGSTPQEDRQSIIDHFTKHIGPACLILNPKAAGSGLNITAATVVIHFTPVWNPALEAQASARAHRRGQSHPVTIYRLFFANTVEQVMIERSKWKADMANESVPVSTRDKEDLKRALEITPK